MIPFTFEGECRVHLSNQTHESVEKVVNRLEHELREQKPRKLSRIGQEISFTGGLLRMTSGWNLLQAFSYGNIKVEALDNELKIDYTLHASELLVISAIFIVAFFAMMREILPAIFLVVIFFVGNVSIGLLRFRRFLQDVATRVAE